MADFDVIVVGAGVAGNAAAIKLAQGGLNTLLVERGKPIGSKNLSGGALWGHELDEILPGWWKEGMDAGAVERPITRKGVGLLTKDSATNIGFSTEEWTKEPYNAFTVLRARFDAWLAAKATEKGVTVVDGVRVDRLATEDRDDRKVVVGVEQDGGRITADCVVLADGCNSRLGMDLGIRAKLSRETYVLGVKEVIQFPSQQALEDRFALGGAWEGLANEFVLGYLENGAKAGGFLYTNRDTVSLGVVVSLDSIWEKGVYAHKIMEEFRLHPAIKPLLRGGEMVEYGAHLIPEGGIHCVPQLYGDGWCVIGDAAGFVYSNGLVIHGMNYAIKSGLLAADAVIAAKKTGGFAAENMASYDRLVRQSYVMKDLEKFEGLHEFVWDDNLHGPIPEIAAGVFKSLFAARGEPKRLTRDIVREQVRKHSLTSLARTAMKGARRM